MNNLNTIIVEGNLVRDPLYKSTPKGTAVCTFSIASNRYLKHDTEYQKEVSFFDVETWARLAENCSNLGHKGRGVRVVGRLKQERWNSNDGKPHSRVMIVAEQVDFRPEMIKKDMDASTNTQSLAEAALELEETTIEEEATIDETVKEEAAALVF
ncbi:hypothetical protein MASR2M78_09930 [Treponema sp.]